jgi:hypothetical protein
MLFLSAVLGCEAGLEFERTAIKETLEPGTQKQAFVFPFVNSGSELVQINKVKGSCGCTTAQPEKTVYAPGEHGELKGTFTVGSREGWQEMSITVVSSDSVSGEEAKKLSLKYEIPRLLESQPSMLLWRTGTEPTEKAIVVELSDEYDVKIKAVEIDSDNFFIQLADGESENEKKILIRPKSTATGSTGKVRADVLINGKLEKNYYFYALVR